MLSTQSKSPSARRVCASARFALAFALAASALAAAPALAQKELHWKSLDVSARLDADGRLHVVERHAMVFTGDWNGGERVFRLSPGQSLVFERIRRLGVSAGTAEARELVRGNLAAVDHYDFVNPTTLRWRSRLPSDPAFSGTELDYEISYTLAGILRQEGNAFVLDHNFALPAAQQVIESLSVDLELDPAWILPPGFARRRSAGRLGPGADYVVHAELGRAAGAGSPASVRRGTTKAERTTLFAVLLVAVIGLAVSFFSREASLGRFAPVPPAESLDEAWLEKRVLSLRPEEAGALWDDKVGAPEVTAVLARLTAEGKLETTASDKEMTLRLRAPLSSFEPYERELLEALFFDGDGHKETSTSAIKSHYKSSGFDPASKLEPGLRERLASHADFQDRSGRPKRWPTFWLFVAGAGLWSFEAASGAVAWSAVVGVFFSTAFWWAIGLGAALLFQRRVERLVPWSLSFLVVPLLYLWVTWRGIATGGLTPLPVLVGQLLLQLAAVNNLFNAAKTRSGPRKLARRRELVAARRYFQRELASPSPRLKDAWFPWIAAFGLAPQVDKWSRSFGGLAARSPVSWSSSTSSSSSSGGSFAGDSGGFTGGGGFSGGAGSSGSWAVAAGALAAGVSAPSSSGGGGGGGGGGGSSGGGGGGGW